MFAQAVTPRFGPLSFGVRANKRMKWIFSVLNIVAVSLFLSSCVSKPKTSVFQWQLDYDVEHGRAVEKMWLGKSRAYTRKKIKSGTEGDIWRFKHMSNGCTFDYVTDKDGRGISYHFISAESTCVYEGKFSGW